MQSSRNYFQLENHAPTPERTLNYKKKTQSSKYFHNLIHNTFVMPNIMRKQDDTFKSIRSAFYHLFLIVRFKQIPNCVYI